MSLTNIPLVKFDDWVRAILATTVVGTFSFCIIYGQMMSRQMPVDEFTVYVGIVTTALGYWLGRQHVTSDSLPKES